jgi:hypothetical protein
MGVETFLDAPLWAYVGAWPVSSYLLGELLGGLRAFVEAGDAASPVARGQELVRHLPRFRYRRL